MTEAFKIFEVIIRSFLMVFVAIYGIVSLGMYIDDKTNHPCGFLDFYGAILVLFICSFI